MVPTDNVQILRYREQGLQLGFGVSRQALRRRSVAPVNATGY